MTPSIDPCPQPASRRDAQDDGWSLAALRAVWTRQQPRVQEQLATIEHALHALAERRLDEGSREQAERAAHTLAGSLAMFGFLAACDGARLLETELANPQPGRAPLLAKLLRQMQDEVRAQATEATAPDSPASAAPPARL